MNIYSCWYQGHYGYCCRRHNNRWMFVPELGQATQSIRKNIAFQDLLFHNPFARQHEMKLELKIQRAQNNPLKFLFSLFFTEQKAVTIGGLLFAPI